MRGDAVEKMRLLLVPIKGKELKRRGGRNAQMDER